MKDKSLSWKEGHQLSFCKSTLRKNRKASSKRLDLLYWSFPGRSRLNRHPYYPPRPDAWALFTQQQHTEAARVKGALGSLRRSSGVPAPFAWQVLVRTHATWPFRDWKEEPVCVKTGSKDPPTHPWTHISASKYTHAWMFASPLAYTCFGPFCFTINTRSIALRDFIFLLHSGFRGCSSNPSHRKM